MHAPPAGLMAIPETRNFCLLLVIALRSDGDLHELDVPDLLQGQAVELNVVDHTTSISKCRAYIDHTLRARI